MSTSVNNGQIGNRKESDMKNICTTNMAVGAFGAAAQRGAGKSRLHLARRAMKRSLGRAFNEEEKTQ